MTLLSALFVIVCAGILVERLWSGIGKIFVAVGLLAVAVVCTNVGANLLVGPLERQTMALHQPIDRPCQAIVVLGALQPVYPAPEFESSTSTSTQVLARLRYGARLYRETGLPIMVSGGRPAGTEETEASVMARILKDEFATPVKWVEANSASLWQQARFSSTDLNRSEASCILLVTSAANMVRAARNFEASGLEVIPAPTDFAHPEPFGPNDFLPSVRAMNFSERGAKEWVFRLRDWFSAL
ncbi:MAG: hypothetical protein JWR21_4337 [Herminiimonas sp.]|nr:hypothetical protein [Herminiimonas sp.]